MITKTNKFLLKPAFASFYSAGVLQRLRLIGIKKPDSEDTVGVMQEVRIDSSGDDLVAT